MSRLIQQLYTFSATGNGADLSSSDEGLKNVRAISILVSGADGAQNDYSIQAKLSDGNYAGIGSGGIFPGPFINVRPVVSLPDSTVIEVQLTAEEL
jgi:hypothetical protein